VEKCDVALIQEPRTYTGTLKGPKEVGGELIYSRSIQQPGTCILATKGFCILPLTQYCSRDLSAVKLTTSADGGPSEIILGSAYLPYDDAVLPPPGELERLVVGCRAGGAQMIIDCDANAYHISFPRGARTSTRGESLFNYVMANGFDIMDRDNRPTFVTSNRQEVIDITITTLYAGNLINNWYVTEEVSCSHHR
jgi:hypothetical protein